MEAKDRIIFPLDGMEPEEAEKWMDRLKGQIGYVKVGLELFLRSGGWGAVEAAHVYGHKVMLDMKLHDIPATMAGATRKAAEMGVGLLTVHASAGRDAMAKCVEVTKGTQTSIVAVTVLTSLDERFMQRVYQPARDKLKMIPNVVERLAEEAFRAGVEHFVCSPHEAGLIHSLAKVLHAEDGPCKGKQSIVITPGIRLAGGEQHDQKRVNTPGAAVEAGADYLVIGRAIREAEDPDATIRFICADIEGESWEP